MSITLADMEAAIRMRDEATPVIKKVEESLTSAIGRIAKLGLEFSGLNLGLKTITGAFLGARNAIISENAQIESAELAFSKLMGSAIKAKEHIAALHQYAAVTPYETVELIQASRTMQSLGGSALNTMENIKLLGDAASVTQAGLQRVAFWVGRMYTAFQSGQPIGQARRYLMQMGVLSAEASIGLEKLRKSGASATEMWNYFKASLEKTKGGMELLSKSWVGVTSTLRDNISLNVAKAGKPIFDFVKQSIYQFNKIFETDTFKNGVEMVRRTLDTGFGFIRDRASKWFLPIWNAAKVVFDKFWQAMQPGLLKAELFIETVVRQIIAIWDRLSGIGQGLDFGPLLKVFHEVGRAVTDVFAAVEKVLGPLVERVREDFERMFSGIEGEGGVNAIIKGVADALVFLIKVVGAVAKAFATLWAIEVEEAWGGMVVTVQKTIFLFNTLVEVVQPMAKLFWQLARVMATSLWDQFVDLLRNLTEVFVALMGAVYTGLAAFLKFSQAIGATQLVTVAAAVAFNVLGGAVLLFLGTLNEILSVIVEFLEWIQQTESWVAKLAFGLGELAAAIYVVRTAYLVFEGTIKTGVIANLVFKFKGLVEILRGTVAALALLIGQTPLLGGLARAILTVASALWALANAHPVIAALTATIAVVALGWHYVTREAKEAAATEADLKKQHEELIAINKKYGTSFTEYGEAIAYATRMARQAAKDLKEAHKQLSTGANLLGEWKKQIDKNKGDIKIIPDEVLERFYTNIADIVRTVKALPQEVRDAMSGADKALFADLARLGDALTAERDRRIRASGDTKDLERENEAAAKAIKKLREELLGLNKIEDADRVVKALKGIGDMSLITAEGLAKVHESTLAAIESYDRLGKEVPPKLRAVKQEVEALLQKQIEFMGVGEKMTRAVGATGAAERLKTYGAALETMNPSELVDEYLTLGKAIGDATLAGENATPYQQAQLALWKEQYWALDKLVGPLMKSRELIEKLGQIKPIPLNIDLDPVTKGILDQSRDIIAMTTKTWQERRQLALQGVEDERTIRINGAKNTLEQEMLVLGKLRDAGTITDAEYVRRTEEVNRKWAESYRATMTWSAKAREAVLSDFQMQADEARQTAEQIERSYAKTFEQIPALLADTLREAFANGKGFAEAFNAMFASIAATLNQTTFERWLGPAIDGLVDWMNDKFQKSGIGMSIGSWLRTNLRNVIGSVASILSSMLASIMSPLRGAINAMVLSISSALASKIPELQDKIREIVARGGDAAKEIAQVKGAAIAGTLLAAISGGLTGYSATEKFQSKMKGVLAGAAEGAMAGLPFAGVTMGWSVVIGAAVGGIAALFGKAKKQADEMRQSFIDAIGGWDDLNEMAANSRWTGGAMALNAFMNAKKTGDVQEAIRQLKEAYEKAKERVDAFAKSAQAIYKQNGLLSPQMMQDITRLGKLGDDVKLEFLETMTQKVADGFNKIAASISGLWTSRTTFDDLVASLSNLDVAGKTVVETVYTISSISGSAFTTVTTAVGGSTFAFKELRDAIIDGVKAGKPFRDVMADIAKLGKGSFKDLQKAMQDAGKDTTALDKLLEQMAQDLTRLGVLGGAAFGAMLASGKSMVDALAALEPGLSDIEILLKASGLSAEGFLGTMLGWRSIVSNNKDLFDMLSGVDDMLVGLNNTGLLTQETFGALAGLIMDAFTALVDQGVNADDAMRMMQPQLQRLWELTRDFKWEVDEGTAALLRQAETSGIVGDQFRSSTDRMVQALETMVDRLNQIVKLLGGEIPKSAQDGASEIGRAFGKTWEVKYKYVAENEPPRPPSGPSSNEPKGYASGSGGLKNFGSGTLAVLHGREAVFTEDQLRNIRDTMNAAIKAADAGFKAPKSEPKVTTPAISAAVQEVVRGGSRAAPQEIRIEVPVEMDGYEIARIVASRIPQVLKQRGVF